MSDFLTNPVITGINAVEYKGLPGGSVLVVTGDDFKVDRVRVTVRDAAGQKLEEGFAVPAHGTTARVWMFTAQQRLPPGQIVTIEGTATDRPGHSVIEKLACEI